MQFKTLRERQILYDFNPMWNLKNETNKQNRNRVVDTKDKLIFAPGEEGWGLGCKVQRKNAINDIVITVNGARRVLEMARGPLCKVCERLTTVLCTWN